MYNVDKPGGPGCSYRRAVMLTALFQMFPDNAFSERWLEESRWGKDGAECPRCESRDRVKESPRRTPAAYRWGACRKRFTIRADTVMAGTKIPYQKRVIAMYLSSSSLDGVSSLKLHRDLGITQNLIDTCLT